MRAICRRIESDLQLNASHLRLAMTSTSSPARNIPLCVELEGGLIRTNLSQESILLLVRSKPWLLFFLPFWRLRGRARFKHDIARNTNLRADYIPYREDVLNWISERRVQGQDLILVTSADTTLAARVAQHLGIFSGVMASDDGADLSGRQKLNRLEAQFGKGRFDYLAPARPHNSIWKSAHAAAIVDGEDGGISTFEGEVAPVRVFPRSGSRSRALSKAMRVRQWTKNVLIFVPLLTAHLVFSGPHIFAALLAFFSFCFCASSVYVINDLLDLEADRQHEKKKTRPFASGALPIRTGLWLTPLMWSLSIAFAWPLPRGVLALLGFYFALTLAYSFYLKRKMLVDVFTLALLYTIRVLLGGAAIGVTCSPWLIGFSLFIFLSLAFSKRCSELFAIQKKSEQAAGRGYFAWDLVAMNIFGIASAYTAAIVLAEYVHSDEVRHLYRHPSWLWLLVPTVLYWMSRVWLLANRGALDEDPIVFATKDRVTYFLTIFALLILFAGAAGNFGLPGIGE